MLVFITDQTGKQVEGKDWVLAIISLLYRIDIVKIVQAIEASAT